MRADAQALDAASRAFILLTAASTGSDLDGSQIAFQSIHEGLVEACQRWPVGVVMHGLEACVPEVQVGTGG